MSKCLVLRLVCAAMVYAASSQATAAQAWIEGFTVKSHSYYWDGVGSWVVSVFVNEPVNTGCAKGDSDRRFSYWASSPNLTHQMILSSAISAEAQNKKIAVLIEDTVCGSDAGRYINGIRAYE